MSPLVKLSNSEFPIGMWHVRHKINFLWLLSKQRIHGKHHERLSNEVAQRGILIYLTIRAIHCHPLGQNINQDMHITRSLKAYIYTKGCTEMIRIF